jgi:PAS domain S-box-containing protein
MMSEDGQYEQILPAIEAFCEAAPETFGQFCPDGLVLLDIRGVVLLANARAGILLGVSSGDLKGRLFSDLLSDRGASLAGGQIGDHPGAEALRTGREVKERLISVGSNEPFWLSVTAQPVCDGNGNLAGAVLSLRDTTRRVVQSCCPPPRGEGTLECLNGILPVFSNPAEAEVTLSRYQQFISCALDSIADPVFVKDREHHFVLVNQAGCDLVRQPREAVLGRPDSDFFPPEELAIFHEGDDRVLSTGGTTSVEEPITYAGRGKRTVITRKSYLRTADGEEFVVGVIRDITDLRQTTEELHRQRHFLDRVFQTTPDWLYAYDLGEDRYEWANQRLSTLLGLPPDEPLQGRSGLLGDLMHPEDRPAFLQQRDQLRRAEDGTILQVDCRLRRGDGRWAWLQFRETPFDRDGQGEVTRLLGHAMDITERKQAQDWLRTALRKLSDQNRDLQKQMSQRAHAESQLAESEKRLQALFTHVQDSMFLCGEDGRILDANPAAVRLTGRSRDDLLKQKIIELAPPGQIGRGWDYWRDFLERGRLHGEWCIRPGSGDDHYVETRAVANILDGVHLVVLQDVSERKHDREDLQRFRFAVDSASSAIALGDLEGRQFYQNPAFTRLLEYATPEDLQRAGGPLVVFVDRPLGEEVLQTVQDGRTWEGEALLRSGRGRVFPALLHADAIRDRHGNFVGLISVIADIGERKRTQEQIRKYNQNLETLIRQHAERILELERQRTENEKLAAEGRLAAQIAHEINNPLAGIKNAFRLVKDAIPADHPRYGFVQRIDEEIERVAGIVRQMFGIYARQRTGLQTVRLGELCEYVVSMLDAGEHLRYHRIDLDVSKDIEIQLPRGSLIQVLYNLILNAVEASPRGETVEVSARQPAGRRVQIRVADRGGGIDPSLRGNIFEPFFSTKQDAEPDRQGMGLGLSITQKIVQDLGGLIRFQDGQPCGTVFIVEVPRELAARESADDDTGNDFIGR